ncbi:MAG: hypothetical protein QOG10_4712, partial [Kribbellaceae bacterium]|jgi:hypothetical protein|nr:hypothetical protein [Kribbellaceae bacterium]
MVTLDTTTHGCCHQALHCSVDLETTEPSMMVLTIRLEQEALEVLK